MPKDQVSTLRHQWPERIAWGNRTNVRLSFKLTILVGNIEIKVIQGKKFTIISEFLHLPWDKYPVLLA
jgi:LEA14-like dessication related protein